MSTSPRVYTPQPERVPISSDLDGIYADQQSLKAFVKLLEQRVAVFQPRYSKSRTPTSRLYAGLRDITRALLVKAQGCLKKVDDCYFKRKADVLEGWGYDLEYLMEQGYDIETLMEQF
ncbi:MAG: hypothetical protein Q9208_006578 [Pyrenodesmia sp. 3 TL-2023]